MKLNPKDYISWLLIVAVFLGGYIIGITMSSIFFRVAGLSHPEYENEIFNQIQEMEPESWELIVHSSGERYRLRVVFDDISYVEEASSLKEFEDFIERIKLFR